MPRLRVKIVNYIRKLLSLRATPHQIAMGFAVGVFIGIFPTFGLGAIPILAFAPLWKFNVPAALLGTMLGNPLLAPLWIGLACLTMGISPTEIKVPNESIPSILGHYGQIGLRYLVGVTAVSCVVAGTLYFPVRWAVQWFRARKQTGQRPSQNLLLR